MSEQATFASRLIRWQVQAGRHDLPWQNTRDPYRIWLSEVMLQQTQVAAVLPYYLRFVERFPDVFTLACAPADEVMALWAGLGYYSRARSLHRCAKEVVAHHGGQFPSEALALEELPGIGRSTAAAIAAFAFGKSEAILDGNVKRVICRVFGIERPMQTQKTERELVALAKTLVPASQIEAYTQGLMDLGATVCTPRRPSCAVCPFEADCVARLTLRIALIPTRKPKRIVPIKSAGFALLEHRGRVFLERRPESGIWGGLWCLPQAAPAADVFDESGARSFALDLARGMQKGADESGPCDQIARFTHGFTHYTLKAFVFRVQMACAPQSDGSGRWVDVKERSTLALPAPIATFFARLAEDSLLLP